MGLSMKTNDSNECVLSSTRDTRYDILRVIGLLCIILAHTYKASDHIVLNQIRSFDVPLMVIISGAVFGITSLKSEFKYKDYLKKRVLRLLTPTWFFLSFFFIFVYILSLITGDKYPFSNKIIVLSYTLISGIGYVWIIRVFLIVAAIAPFILKFHNKEKKHIIYFGTLLVFYIIYEISYFYYASTGIWILDKIIENIYFYLIPYGCLFALGLRLPNLSKKSILIIVVINLILFILCLLNFSQGKFVPSYLYKYPPRIYYISYAITVSFLLYLAVNNKFAKKINNHMIIFISSSSMTIYLWHILFIYLWNLSTSFRPTWANSFTFMFFTVGGLAIITTYIQTHLIIRYKKELNVSSWHQ